jgi:RNA polymerase sigma factor (sigma-70 family)
LPAALWIQSSRERFEHAVGLYGVLRTRNAPIGDEPDRHLGASIASMSVGVASDVRTFDEVYAARRAPMVRLAYVLVRSRMEAEEVVHDAFLRLHERFEEVESPEGFLHTVVVRLAITLISRRDMERDRVRSLPDPGPTGEPNIDDMWELLGRVPIDRRTVLVLRYYADLSHAQIAELVGCPEATVRSRLHRGLADLRKEINP